MLSLEWLGGFFDGEGCVRFDNQHAGYFVPQLTVTQKFPGVLKSIQKEMGGKIYGKGPNTGGFHLRWSGPLAFQIAALLCSVCVEKRPQLELLLKAQTVAPRDRGDFAERVTQLKQQQSAYSST